MQRLLVILLGACCVAPVCAGQPNIVLLLVDDSGLESLVPVVAKNVPLDLVAPDAPASISIRFGSGGGVV